MAEKVEVQTCFSTHIAEETGIDAEDRAAEENRKQKACGIQLGERNAGPHTCGEEREAEHDNEHGPEALTTGFRNPFKGIVYVDMFFFNICFHRIHCLPIIRFEWMIVCTNRFV